jgi:outer membrane murein-binding lipoprotein Lpp
MKKIIFAVFLLSMTISCEDYDERFDDLNSSIEQLAAENAALEAQIAALQGASASGAQATAAKLAEFQDAVTAIIALKFAVEEKNLTDKKELVEPVQVLSEALFGEVVV